MNRKEATKRMFPDQNRKKNHVTLLLKMITYVVFVNAILHI